MTHSIAHEISDIFWRRTNEELMAVQVHGFNWTVYTEKVMPAFEQWLIEGDEIAALQLFEQTRCAYEERFLPDPMQRLRVWTRARAFAQTLPRGPYSRREYLKLCSAEQFTALSDRYLYKHAPQLYQRSDALRSVWGAIVETFCLPWQESQDMEEEASKDADDAELSPEDRITRSELLSLLQEAGLNELAQEIEEPSRHVEHFAWETSEKDRSEAKEAGNVADTRPGGELTNTPASVDLDVSEEVETIVAAQGIRIGHQLNLLHLRGWLARISVRAMALFEYLACGRRAMPFGFEAGEPFGAFSGYLTPDEVWQLAICLDGVTPPDQKDAEEDYLNFRYQQVGIPAAFRLVDEVLPTHTATLLHAIEKAVSQGLGLITSIE
jgi:hypothetical protein